MPTDGFIVRQDIIPTLFRFPDPEFRLGSGRSGSGLLCLCPVLLQKVFDGLLREVHDVPVLVGNLIKKMMRDDHTGTRTFSPIISVIYSLKEKLSFSTRKGPAE